MTIRAVAFDIGSVITQVDPDYFAAIEADFGLTRAEWGPLLHGPEAAEHNMPAVPWHTEDVVTYFTSVLKPRCGSKASAAAERLAGVYVSLDALTPVEGMVELLLGLRRAGRPVGLLSNGPVESGSELMPVLLGAALPDVIVLSGSHGVTKPDPYLHDGRLLTLDDTVEFFNLILGTKLTSQEKAALVAFLTTL